MSGCPSRKRSAPPDSIPESSDLPASPSWLERLANYWLHFDRFGWDVAGIFLLALALISLLGLVGKSWAPFQGAVLSPWITFLTRWLGWGSYVAVLAIAYGGFLALQRRTVRPMRIPLGHLLALEGAYFSLLALMAYFGGNLLSRAEAGLDGGIIGWGMAYLVGLLLPPPWSTVLLLLITLLLLAIGLGLTNWLGRWIEKQILASEGEENSISEEPDEKPLSEETIPATQTAGPDTKADSLSGLSTPPVRNPVLPPFNLLSNETSAHPDEAVIHDTAMLIEQTLAEFGIPARVVGYRVGPTVTQYAIEPGFVEKTGPDGNLVHQKVRVSQISALARDLALALSASRLRIEAPVPGRSYVGIEVPNPHTSLVRLRPVLESETFQKLTSPLAIALGKDVSGQPMVADLARMPHLLIAGTTGSGKSVCITALTTCLLMNNTPQQLRIAMLDPKMVELVRFNGVPHLLGKVETEQERMLGVLKWALMEMDNRYRLLEEAHARDLVTFNRKQERKKLPTLPRIVLIIDELADLMMTSPEQTEHSLVRLAQLARATGIHLVVATQRPSTDVVTGLIKANFPARVSFAVASSVDSRVILDTGGAETLLGHGDMLFIDPEVGSPQRAQGVLVTDAEVEKLVTFWQKSAVQGPAEAAPWEELVAIEGDKSDEMLDQAIQLVKRTQRASASLLQRRLRIGYPRAARLLDELEAAGVVGPSVGSGKDREVLLPNDDDEEDDEEGMQDYNKEI
ncbi:DNA segregation ATPase FtsK/SpoIIIE [Longilinea arvoryzae]|uniref:DNA segregation ATPase FtsK/SpoIIIE n=1 Tax=Longilinea arvoryzae TaxID=360412 RepID=A0A0S7BMW6_9CHLR|nr:DNA translocase FtsK [Longilinea arvoryzae]GAP15141.1 DNA segregation ATPase FtsK/SpoIIIE [Longilinea arvoryzae]